MRVFFTLTLILASFDTWAEYRAYQYLVKTHDPYAVATQAKPQYIISNLNPQMFQRYHGGKSISIDLLRTWMCPGYTGARKTVCPHPYDKDRKI